MAIAYIAGKRGARKLAKAVRQNNGKGVSKSQARRLAKAGVVVKKRKAGLLKKVWRGIKKISPIMVAARIAAKTQLPHLSPFFLYLFIDEKILSKMPEKVIIKRQKELHYKNILVEKLAMKESNFTKIVRNGIMSNYGKSPEEVLASWMKQTHFSVGFIPPQAIKAGFDILKKLLGKFAENLKADMEEFGPAKEDFGEIEAPAERAELSGIFSALPNNNDPTKGKGSVKSLGNGDYHFSEYDENGKKYIMSTAYVGENETSSKLDTGEIILLSLVAYAIFK